LEAYKSIKYRLSEEAPAVLNSLIDVEKSGGGAYYIRLNFLSLLFQSGECYQ
jgi:hypothetical protein